MSYYQSINYYLFHSVLFFSVLIFLKSAGSFFYKKRYSRSDKKLLKVVFFLCCFFLLTSIFYIQEINKLLLILMFPIPFLISFLTLTEVDSYKVHLKDLLTSFFTLMIIGVFFFYKNN
tara:strand:+ start:101 stop:454 length:354 start_codon:yes stop_codon:yes gene_type:complete